MDLGVGREGLGHPFFFEILCYFYRILRKVKSIYIAGKCLGHPFLNFLDPPMSATYVFGILHFCVWFAALLFSGSHMACRDLWATQSKEWLSCVAKDQLDHRLAV